MLSDIRFYHRKGLTGAWSSHNPRTSEWIDDVYPAVSEFATIIITHRYIDREFIFYQVLRLFKALILQIEAVFHKSVSEILRNVIQGNMYGNYTYEGEEHIYPDICLEKPYPAVPVPIIDEY